jgi:hypothetical protein
MRPDAKKTDLLYVSDRYHRAVDVYSYKTPNSKGLLGQLAGFGSPGGECSDSAGNVYVTDSGFHRVVEYAKGGTAPIGTLGITGAPVGCSVDRTTGNLAVSAARDAKGPGSDGGVWVFADATGTPTLYQDPDLHAYWSPGYDIHGNLFVEGISRKAAGKGKLDELPHDGRGLIENSLSGGYLAPARQASLKKWGCSTDVA